MDTRSDQDRDHLIRERAYAIWLEEGCPDGRADEHWHRAAEAIGSEQDTTTPLRDTASDPVLLPPNR